MTLDDVVHLHQEEERRKAVRTMLRTPLITPAHADYPIVRRHAGHLTDWFGRETGWSFHADLGVARLKKIPARRSDGTRPATAKGRPFSRRRYVLACLALAALERAESQVTLGWLVTRVLIFAQDEDLSARGIVFTLDNREERGDLAAVARLLLETGILRRVAGDEQSFVNNSGDALYDVDRRVLAVLLATRRGPSLVGDDRQAISEDLVADTEEGRNRQVRHTLSRRLLDDPIVYYADLTDEERLYLDRQRGPLLKRLTDATGLISEVRAEGIALLDPTREASDYTMPDEGTDGHATLLLAEYLSKRLRGNRGPVTVEQAVAQMRELIARHSAHWRKNTRDPGGDRLLTQQALHRLSALGLVDVTGGTVAPLPALARFGYAPPRITRKS
jgi:uncharacterized protein (TIGR02678 family)